MRAVLRSLRAFAGAVGLALLAACSSAGPPGGADAGADGTTEAGGADVGAGDAAHDVAAADGPADGSPVDAGDAGADVAPADSGDGASDGGADGGGPSDAASGGEAGGSDASADASDAGGPFLDGGPLAAGTYACATCIGAGCSTPCPPGMQSCGSSCVVGSLDPSNCGACGRACTGTDVCLLGVCTPRAATVVHAGITGATSVATDAQSVYFADSAGIHSVPKAGGSAIDVATGTGVAGYLTVSGAYLYWSENAGGAIMRAPKDGSGAPALVATATQPGGFVIVGDTLYWASTAFGDSNVYEVAADGGAAGVLVSPSLMGFTSGYSTVVNDGTTLFVGSDWATWRIALAPDGGAPTVTSSTTVSTWRHGGCLFARPGDVCGCWAQIGGGAGVTCELGGMPFGAFDSVTSWTLPACGMVYTDKDAVQGTDATYVVSDYSLSRGQRTQQTLTTDLMQTAAGDGLSVYFVNQLGELRVLPVP